MFIFLFFFLINKKFKITKHISLYIVDIPQRLIFTKVEKLDLCGNGDVSGVFRSRHAEKKVEFAKKEFCLRDCQILPVANYVRGTLTRQNINEDVLALLAIDNVLEESLAYIKNEVN